MSADIFQLSLAEIEHVRRLFQARIFVVPYERGCWLWTGHIDDDGYGTIKLREIGESPIRAHRLSFMLNRGRIPGGMGVLHRCDIRSCVRPDHLWTGTSLENNLDAAAKGRTTRGEKNPKAKLTEAQVIEARRLYATGNYTHRSLSQMFGLASKNIGFLLRRQQWRHI